MFPFDTEKRPFVKIFDGIMKIRRFFEQFGAVFDEGLLHSEKIRDKWGGKSESWFCFTYGELLTPDGTLELSWRNEGNRFFYRFRTPNGYSVSIENNSDLELSQL